MTLTKEYQLTISATSRQKSLFVMCVCVCLFYVFIFVLYTDHIGLPDLYCGKSSYTENAASTGPLVMISVWICSTPRTKNTELAEKWTHVI